MNRDLTNLIKRIELAYKREQDPYVKKSILRILVQFRKRLDTLKNVRSDD